jgi:hypothetical protein
LIAASLRNASLLAVAAFLLLACDQIQTLRLRNESASTYLTRTTIPGWAGDRPHTYVYVEEVPPGADDYADRSVGGYPDGTLLELLATDCSVLGSWRLPPAGGHLIIGKSGAAQFYSGQEGDEPPNTPPAPSPAASPTGRAFRSVLRCGATDTVEEPSG